MIRWFFGHWEIWLGIAALVIARMLGAYFSKIGEGAAQKMQARVYVLRTPDGRKKKIVIKPNEDLESKMRLAVSEDQARRARAN